MLQCEQNFYKAAVRNVHLTISGSVCLPPQVLHVSGAALLHSELKNSRVEVLDNCGHAVAIEQPKRAADIIVDFLSAQEVEGKSAKKHP